MWPLERNTVREHLRLGRTLAQRWQQTKSGLTLQATQALQADAIENPTQLIQVLRELYAAPATGPVSVLLESSWLPVLLADTGGRLWRRAQTEALLRHQFAQLYGHQSDSVAASWEMRIDHRDGERFALGYALAPRLKQTLLDAAGPLGLRLHALAPALSWGWAHQKLRLRSGCWAWPEQDRLLLAEVQGGRIVTLNAAAPLVSTSAALERAVDIEGLRQGRDLSGVAIHIASWSLTSALPASTPRTKWHSIVGDETAHAAHRPLTARATP